MKSRTLSKILGKAIKTFPAIVVTGPRQSGKTTLLKAIFGKTHQFISLEDSNVRSRAQNDPRLFLEQYKPPLILDEIQYVPELLSYIKTKIDNHRKPGQWLLTGSQHFGLMQGVSQSLAGRAAILSLLPFSYAERNGYGEKVLPPIEWFSQLSKKTQWRIPSIKASSSSITEVILRGSYPEIVSHPQVDRQLWCGSYIATYLERDVRNISTIGDLGQFERFVKLCAIRTGQILNLSEMAKDIGLSFSTAKRWLSILEAGHIVYLLYPYYKNIGKRLIKSPKIYFCDTALATYFMGLHDKETLLGSSSFGTLFETWIVMDFLKRFLHAGQLPSLYYLKTRDGLEIDLVIEMGQALHCFEIKSGMTIMLKHADALRRLKNEWGEQIKTMTLISNDQGNFWLTSEIRHLNWKSTLGI